MSQWPTTPTTTEAENQPAGFGVWVRRQRRQNQRPDAPLAPNRPGELPECLWSAAPLSPTTLRGIPRRHPSPSHRRSPSPHRPAYTTVRPRRPPLTPDRGWARPEARHWWEDFVPAHRARQPRTSRLRQVPSPLQATPPGHDRASAGQWAPTAGLLR